MAIRGGSEIKLECLLVPEQKKKMTNAMNELKLDINLRIVVMQMEYKN